MTGDRDALETSLRASIKELKASLTKQEAADLAAAAEFGALRLELETKLADTELEVHHCAPLFLDWILGNMLVVWSCVFVLAAPFSTRSTCSNCRMHSKACRCAQ